MFAREQYELIDFGDGRKLERFGLHTIDRPAPAARAPRALAARWAEASARFDEPRLGTSGRWSGPLADCAAADARWTVAHPPMRFELRLASSGQVGVFPEQAANWDWLADRVRGASEPIRVLNLFAYTGGSTMACALGGAAVTHVDASRSAVAWARANADASDMPHDRVRWLVEDARRFVEREIRRRRRYDAVVLDPPTFGRGPRGETWSFESDMPGLLTHCRALLVPMPRFILLTGHTTNLPATRIRDLLALALPNGATHSIDVERLALQRPDGAELWSGWSGKMKG